MLMPGRQYAAASSYRYGFNGKENDNEVKGVEGSQQDYGMRVYDTRLGKFLSMDPLSKDYPWYTPYQFAGNTPIQAIDLDGAEPWFNTDRGFSIKSYYEIYNPLKRFLKNPRGDIGVIINHKHTYDAVQRLKEFSSDNHNQYLKSKKSGEKQVYASSKKLGFLDCVSAQESALQIITNNFDIKLKKGGNAEASGEKWEKEGVVGKALTFKLSNFSKKSGDIVEKKDIKFKFDIAKNLRNEAENTAGTVFFTFELGKDFHGGIAGVTLQLNVSGTLNATYFISDQTTGYRSWDTEEGFNNFFRDYIFLNSTSESNGSRVYNPGSTDTSTNISEGNEKVVFRRVKKEN